ncbi:unnamed protein product [Pleuronectes platessa]|uniref:Uncharacterized protein n=1 Tax=Pleuronectes platessa TaxID=8262 RepID=A0A9N7ULF0_PLEPL|nr:unnamed protein product [Pleuronectes platessa]
MSSLRITYSSGGCIPALSGNHHQIRLTADEDRNLSSVTLDVFLFEFPPQLQREQASLQDKNWDEHYLQGAAWDLPKLHSAQETIDSPGVASDSAAGLHFPNQLFCWLLQSEVILPSDAVPVHFLPAR